MSNRRAARESRRRRCIRARVGRVVRAAVARESVRLAPPPSSNTKRCPPSRRAPSARQTRGREARAGRGANPGVVECLAVGRGARCRATTHAPAWPDSPAEKSVHPDDETQSAPAPAPPKSQPRLCRPKRSEASSKSRRTNHTRRRTGTSVLQASSLRVSVNASLQYRLDPLDDTAVLGRVRDGGTRGDPSYPCTSLTRVPMMRLRLAWRAPSAPRM